MMRRSPFAALGLDFTGLGVLTDQEYDTSLIQASKKNAIPP